MLATIGIFGLLVYPDVDVIALIGREKMKESPFFDQVRALGAVDAKRESLLQVLRKRFGESVEELKPSLEQIADKQRLEELLDVALDARRLSQFRRALGLN